MSEQRFGWKPRSTRGSGVCSGLRWRTSPPVAFPQLLIDTGEEQRSYGVPGYRLGQMEARQLRLR